jgi:hypothetical protein
MRNHFHLVIETPEPTLVRGMQWPLGTYTARFNARHKLRGHLFSGRYKSIVVDEAEDGYLRRVSDIHTLIRHAPESWAKGRLWKVIRGAATRCIFGRRASGRSG